MWRNKPHFDTTRLDIKIINLKINMMHSTDKAKYMNITILVLGSIPWIFSISLLMFYFHAWYVLGYAPSPYSPDPADVWVSSIYGDVIGYSFVLWFLSFIPWIVCSIIYVINQRKAIHWKRFVGSMVGQVLAIKLILSKIFVWFVD